MKMISKSLVFGAALAVHLATLAQTNSIPIPGSSVSAGGRAVVTITPPMSRDEVEAIASASGGAGATVLPHSMPPGTYRNQGSFPLMLVVPIGNGQSAQIYANGQQVAHGSNADSGTSITISAIIPAGAEVRLTGRRNATVTAMRNNATWQMTGIRFPLCSDAGFPVFGGSICGTYTAVAVDDAPVFRDVFQCTFALFSEFGAVYSMAFLYPGSTCGNRLSTPLSQSAGSSAATLVSAGVYREVPGTFAANTATSGVAGSSGRVTSGIYSRNIRENVGTCRGEQLVGDNWGQTTVFWSATLRYTGSAGDGRTTITKGQCTPENMVNLRLYGNVTPPPPSPV